MTRLIRVTSLVLGFLLVGLAHQSAATNATEATASCPQWQSASQSTPKLFLNDDNTAFLDVDGRLVLSASDPRLQEEIRRVSRGFAPFREREDSASSRFRFEEFSEG